MNLLLDIDIKKLPGPINYRNPLLLMGSCFTEHIGKKLGDLKFPVLQNPHGILFDPNSVCRSLLSYMHKKIYRTEDLFYDRELWHSWEHHGRFSGTDIDTCVKKINQSQIQAHEFLKKADWIIITLGSAFSYELLNKEARESFSANGQDNYGVANCHRAPAQWFRKRLMEIDEISSQLTNCLQALRDFRPELNFLFSVSPVRHIRDGVVENNRSKARLIETIHSLVDTVDRVYYFPAYEIVIDVLRDYRFYDIDLVHPNYTATEYVMEKFAETCIDDESRMVMEEVARVVLARKHKALQPDTNAHRQFLNDQLERTRSLQAKYPFLGLEEEIEYFSPINHTPFSDNTPPRD